MQKSEYLNKLSRALKTLKREERQRSISYYSELIDDKIESGMTEEEAVASLEDIGVTAEHIISDATERGMLKQKKNPLVIALLIVGSPLWIAVAAALFSVLLAVLAVVWSAAAAILAVTFSFAVAPLAAIVFFATNVASNTALACFSLGLGFVFAALAALLFRVAIGAVKKFAGWTKKLCTDIYNKIKRKGKAGV